MTAVYSKALDQTLDVNRELGRIGDGNGPTTVFFAGIHGNEPSGVFALYQVFNELREQGVKICGTTVAFAGNLWALHRQERFHTHDLNRLFTEERIKQIKAGALHAMDEDSKQQLEILDELQELLENTTGPHYFLDLHTTSAETMPFLTVNDSILNRTFAEQYPAPMILGIEEFLDGPLLSYVNDLGYVSFGFEGGQHDDLASIENHKAFVYLSLVFAGNLNEEQIDFQHHFQVLSKNTVDTRHIFEIYYRHVIKPNEHFEMKPGFVNFQRVHKGEEIAMVDGEILRAANRGRIFMPLYQQQGEDGFFAIREIPRFFLNLSSTLRKIRFDRVLTLLPGVRWVDQNRKELLVNRRIARLFTKPFFHLLGYRSRRLSKQYYTMSNREASSRKQDYIHTKWMRS